MTNIRRSVGVRRVLLKSVEQNKESLKVISNPVQVIDRMTMLLDALASGPHTASLKFLAEKTGLHSSTVYRILNTLTPTRIIERTDQGTYRLGIRLLELGNIVKNRMNLRDVALPFMHQLHEAIGESINLGIRNQDEIIYIERISSNRSLVRVVYLVGGRAPLHLTSVGKMFLAKDGYEQVEQYAMRTGLPGKTLHSLSTLPMLEKELARIRRHNIAYDNEEAELGLKCIAAPIFDDEGRMVAGLSVSAPTDRFDSGWIDPLRKTANGISQALGYKHLNFVGR